MTGSTVARGMRNGRTVIGRFDRRGAARDACDLSRHTAAAWRSRPETSGATLWWCLHHGAVGTSAEVLDQKSDLYSTTWTMFHGGRLSGQTSTGSSRAGLTSRARSRPLSAHAASGRATTDAAPARPGRQDRLTQQ